MTHQNNNSDKQHESHVKAFLSKHKNKPKKKNSKKHKNAERFKITGSYGEYLLGEWWRSKKKQKLESVGWKCERCRDTRKLQVHHIHYNTLGREKNKDLQVLCEVCHAAKHEILIQADSHLRSINNPA